MFTLVNSKGTFTSPLLLSEQPAMLDMLYTPHDYQLADMVGSSVWTDDINRDGKNRWYPRQIGNPETVATPIKEERTVMTEAWQWYHFNNMLLAACGHYDFKRLSAADQEATKQAWGSAMAGNRVITNNTGPDHNNKDDTIFFRDYVRNLYTDQSPFRYMSLLMGGNIYNWTGNTKTFAKFGECYEVESLNGSQPPPDIEKVNIFTAPQYFSYATICRYNATLANPWSHVIPFPQFEPWNAHTILLNVSPYGVNWLPKNRAVPWDDPAPNPYNPSKQMSH